VVRQVVGRDQELEAAARFFDDLGDTPAALVFAGEPGIGKTTLWAETLERARENGFVVLAARGGQAEAKLAFAALSDLLDPIANELLPVLPEPQRRAVAVALLREEPGASPLDQRAIGAATATMLSALARGGRVVVGLDDLQWVDRPSARALDFALRRLGGQPVGVVASERIEPGLKMSLELDRAFAEGAVTRHTVGPLSLAALHELLKLRLGRSFPRRTLLAVDQAAGGNPFFALEIARSLPDDVSPGLGGLPVPENLLDLVETRISTLPQSSRKPLLAAAAAPSPTVELVAAAAGLTPSRSRAALEGAAAAGIVHVEGSEVRFSHPLFAAAVYSSATPAERRGVHRRLAETVRELEERARHLGLASETADEETAATLDAAAEHAQRRGAPDTAAALAEQARLLTPPDRRDQVWRRTTKVAEYRFHAGELRSARETFEAVIAERPPDPIRAGALRLLGETLCYERSFIEAIPVLEEAAAIAGDDALLRSGVELDLAFASNLAGDWVTAREHANRAVEIAEPLGAAGGLAEALAVSAMASFLLGAGFDEAKVARALELEDPDRQILTEMQPSLIAGLMRLYEGKPAQAVEVLERLRKRAIERGEDAGLPFVSGNLAWAEAMRGELSSAAGFAEEALEWADRVESDTMRCWALAYGALPAAFAGEHDVALARADACDEISGAAGVQIAGFWTGWARAILALSEGDPERAAAAVTPFLALFEERGLPDPILGFFYPDAVEALAALGELEQAQRALDVFDESARRTDRAWAVMVSARSRALLESARGDLARAAEAVDEAVAAAEGVELRLEVARTLLVAGQVERRRRRKQAARDALEQALGIFEGMGARLWAAKARDELERVSLRRAAQDELTESERRVAELAAAGLTNRNVAAQLFISPKTVEANLARAYRKLGIRSRAELGARLAKPETTTKP